jgi:hypothetical protein
MADPEDAPNPDDRMDLAERLREALSDRPSLALLTLSDRERRFLRMVAGRDAVLNQKLVEDARDNPRAREQMECRILLLADNFLSAEEISQMTDGLLTAGDVADFVACWVWETKEYERRRLKMAEVLTPDRLTGTMIDILTAAKDLGAVDLGSARPVGEIAAKAGHPSVNSRNVRDALAKMREAELLGAKPGQGGGRWITSKGIEFLARRLANPVNPVSRPPESVTE